MGMISMLQQTRKATEQEMFPFKKKNFAQRLKSQM
jgi:hypothetical protein